MHRCSNFNFATCKLQITKNDDDDDNKKAAWSLCNGVWMTHSDINKVKVISELLSIRHRPSYVNLD